MSIMLLTVLLVAAVAKVRAEVLARAAKAKGREWANGSTRWVAQSLTTEATRTTPTFHIPTPSKRV